MNVSGLSWKCYSDTKCFLQLAFRTSWGPAQQQSVTCYNMGRYVHDGQRLASRREPAWVGELSTSLFHLRLALYRQLCTGETGSVPNQKNGYRGLRLYSSGAMDLRCQFPLIKGSRTRGHWSLRSWFICPGWPKTMTSGLNKSSRMNPKRVVKWSLLLWS
jgi:hypothetical protein